MSGKTKNTIAVHFTERELFFVSGWFGASHNLDIEDEDLCQDEKSAIEKINAAEVKVARKSEQHKDTTS